MRLLAPLLIALAAGCSNGQAASHQVGRDDTQQLAATVRAQVPYSGRVADSANIIGAKMEATLNSRLAKFEKATSHQMAVVTVKSLDGKDVADFTRELANAWGVGRKDHNDGVVVLIAPNERKVRIAVGNGLESELPNSLCQSIIKNLMLPRFREGKLEIGIEAGVNALIDKLD